MDRTPSWALPSGCHYLLLAAQAPNLFFSPPGSFGPVVLAALALAKSLYSVGNPPL